ncbi:hypothetical protein [Deinococcus frigens]|uniref:hypothetical protein n=1 Tax=Deinococcus frigens TaxID=249403 RepID=UPI000495A2E9|nr:hypothetical protein [Deinococcus frigens]
MKASEWLVRATQDLPTGVTARVKADTLAHLHDAGVDEQEDVRPLLGRPDDTAAELRRLYLTNDEWIEQRTGGKDRTGFNLSEWLVLGLPALLWLVLEVLEARAPFHGVWSIQGLLLLLLVVTLWLTQRFHPVRRRNWRLWIASVCFMFMQWPAVTELLFGGYVWLALVTLLLWLVYCTKLQLGRDARLARTLALEGEQA